MKGRKTKVKEIVENNNFLALAKKNNNDRKDIQETEFVFVVKQASLFHLLSGGKKRFGH